MKRVIVTGASGFIGRHSLPFLMQKGYEVHGVLPSGKTPPDIQGVEWHVADLLDLPRIPALLKNIGPSHLLHFAWHTAPGEYWTSADNIRWLQASLELLRSFGDHGGQRIVMAGSCAEYDWRYGYCSEPVTPLDPTSLYGVCKNSLRSILMSYAHQKGFSAAWGRIFFLYGPNEYSSRLVPSVITAILDNKPALCTNANQVRDFLYVEDVASAFASLLDSELDEAVNIASGEPIALKELIYRIAENLGRPDLVQLGALPVSENEPPLLVADVHRLKQKLSWSPKYDLDTGLKKTIEYWKQRKI